ncbi:MAG: polymer-forming cytoskeletal protein [Kouleothrix sp.]|nr:polymer-forming cytoskeletal protein [Kouleothrix sp.]
MFGRRNPDRPLDAATPASDIDLDMLDALPDLPAPPPAPRRTETPAADGPPPDPAWHAATPSILGPSVTRLLQEAEATRQRPAPDAAAALEARPAPATQPLQAILAGPELAPEAPPPAAPPVAIAPAAATAPLGSELSSLAPARAIAESVIGPDDFFDGRYRSERGVRIQGNARGSIESRQYIYVEAGAQVEADLSAEEITVSGNFHGKITCRGRLEVTSTGQIQGQIQTALLIVQQGGAIDGELHMRAQDDAAPDGAAPGAYSSG